MRTSSAIFIVSCLFAARTACAQGFKFPDPQKPEAPDAAQVERNEKIQAQLSTACSERLRNRKIMVLLAEERNGALAAQQAGFGRHVEAINTRLQRLGLKTYTPEQIRKQIAQAEIDAYFRNDPDAAMAASKKLAAQHVLRGVIVSNAERNALVKINQVRVDMNFTLSDASGKAISSASARSESWAGSDTAGMALTLIEERADEVVAQLYSDYCNQSAQR